MKNKFYLIRAEILDKAADLIDSGGWWQGGTPCFNSSHCAATALNKAAGALCGDNEDIFMQNKDLSYRIQYVVITRNFNEITAWNDHPKQTKENVVSHMRFIASEYRKKSA